MTVRLTKKQFMRRFEERASQINYSSIEEIEKTITTQNIETKINKIIASHLSNVVDAVYQEP
jgi:hypothetical protein